MQIKQTLYRYPLLLTLSFLLSACNPLTSLFSAASNNKQEAQSTPTELPEFLITTLNAVPGHSITYTSGYYCRMFVFDGVDYHTKFNQVLSETITEGKKNNMQALVNFSTQSIPFSPTTIESATQEAVINTNNKSITTANKASKNSNVTQSITQICGDMVMLKAN